MVGSRPRAYRFDGFELDLGSHRLMRAGRPLAIEPRVFDALVHLLENRDRLVTKEELFAGVWPDEAVSDNALSRTITRLRQSLGDDSRRPRYIETVHGRGYRFVAPVEIGEQTTAPPTAPATGLPAAPRRLRLAVALAALALAGVTGWWLLAGTDPHPPTRTDASRDAAATLEPLRVAVLPMRDLGGAEESRLFADGLTEQMISVLSQIPGIRVLSGRTTMTYRDAGRRISEIARDLGAGTMLAGSVRRDGERLRVTVELIDAANEELVWSRQFDTRPEDVFAVQSEVATQVADALQVSLPVTAVRRIREGPTREMTAYEHYLRGRQAYRQITRTGNETAIQHYEKALEADPGFALARASLAAAYALRQIRFGFEEEERTRAEAFARAALAADPQLPEAHKALGMIAFSRGRLRLAIEHNTRAVELNPSYDEAFYNLASYSALLGAWDEAVLYQLRASTWVHGRAALVAYLLVLDFDSEGERLAASVLEEEPLARYLSLNLAEHEFFDGEVVSARERTLGIIAAEPTWTRGHRLAGDMAFWQGDRAAAVEHYRRAVQSSDGGDSQSSYRLGLIDRLAGRDAAARQRLAPLETSLLAEARKGSETALDYWLLGSLAAAKGDLDEATAWRDRAIAHGWLMHWRDATDPALRPLAGDPRFQDQLRRMRQRVDTMRERVAPEVARALPRLLQLRG